MKPSGNFGRSQYGKPQGNMRERQENQISQQDNELPILNEFRQKVKSLSNLTDELIFHPDPKKGYGSKIAQSLKIKPVQLRRVYQEFLRIVDKVKANKMEEAMGKLYRLYAIVQYQASRRLIPEEFKELLHYLFDLIRETECTDKHKESFYKVKDLLMSIVAYSKEKDREVGR